ncbi:hypothetical protein COO60DRAFT_1601073, partial [Scenedesmus sp. NREL 46B-D3]
RSVKVQPSKQRFYSNSTKSTHSRALQQLLHCTSIGAECWPAAKTCRQLRDQHSWPCCAMPAPQTHQPCLQLAGPSHQQQRSVQLSTAEASLNSHHTEDVDRLNAPVTSKMTPGNNGKIDGRCRHDMLDTSQEVAQDVLHMHQVPICTLSSQTSSTKQKRYVAGLLAAAPARQQYSEGQGPVHIVHSLSTCSLVNGAPQNATPLGKDNAA